MIIDGEDTEYPFLGGAVPFYSDAFLITGGVEDGTREHVYFTFTEATVPQPVKASKQFRTVVPVLAEQQRVRAGP